MSQNILKLKRAFLEHLEIEKGRSLKTVENYDRYLKRFFDFASISSPVDISKEKIKEFRLYLNRSENGKSGMNSGSLKKNTQNYYLIALRSFLKYLSLNDVEALAPEKIELAKSETKELDLINRKDFEKLMALPEKVDLEVLRDQAILEMLYSTGLRVSELCGLDRDIDFSANEFSVRGKGGKLRLVFLSERAKNAVKKYLDTRDREYKFSNALFISSKGNRVGPRLVQRTIKKRALEAGIVKNVTPHTLRHYFATDLLKNGADIRSVQMLLGHASINTTQIYTNLSDKYLKEVHEKFHDS